jgi:hypothetical protein
MIVAGLVGALFEARLTELRAPWGVCMRTGTPSLPRRFSKRTAGWLESGSVGRRSPRLRAALITPDHPSCSNASAIRTTYLPNALSRTCTVVDRGGVANGRGGLGRLRFLGEGVALAVSGGVKHTTEFDLEDSRNLKIRIFEALMRFACTAVTTNLRVVYADGVYIYFKCLRHPLPPRHRCCHLLPHHRRLPPPPHCRHPPLHRNQGLHDEQSRQQSSRDHSP